MATKKEIKKRVDSFESACEQTGEYPVFTGLTRDEIAYRKLKVIAKALRKGRLPDVEKGEWIYYPVFFVYSKAELDAMSEEEIEERGIRRFGGTALNGAPAGWRFAYTNYRFSHAIAYSGFRLCVFSSEDAEYLGRQFIDLWGEYLFSVDAQIL